MAQFEGPEKKFELCLHSRTPSLRRRDRAFWDQLVQAASATILSQISNDQCDAFLLSESSLFVYDHKILMITCGQTTLVNAVEYFLNQISADDVELFIFERKNENFPELQHSSFEEDCSKLQKLLPGENFTFGDRQGHYVSVYSYEKLYTPPKDDSTLELLMYGIDPEAQKLFSNHQPAQDVRNRIYFKDFFGDYQFDDYFFEPQGYSLNAINGNRYLTIHATPQEQGSFISLETNRLFSSSKEITRFVRQVTNLLRPQALDVVSFQNPKIQDERFFEYRVDTRDYTRLEAGYPFEFTNYLRAPAGSERKSSMSTSNTFLDKPKQRHLNLWVEERHQDIFGLRFKVKKVLFSEDSPFQQVDIVETAGHGKMLLNDGLVMVSERDEFIYHEMIAHPALFTHPNPKRVLVIGGGDGGTVREVIRHPSVEYCRLVEIDDAVVRGCKEHIPQTASCLDDPRVEVSIMDGVKYMAETQDRYDVILIDSTDPIGPAAPLFGPEFYQNVTKVLTEDGIVVSQGESPYYELETQKSMLKVLKSVFPRLFIYNYTNLTYPGGFWSFTLASKKLSPLTDFDSSRAENFEDELKYYHGGIHRAAFELPSFMKRAHRELVENS